jgi:hypothetical protein
VHEHADLKAGRGITQHWINVGLYLIITTQPKRSARQVRRSELLSNFNLRIAYIQCRGQNLERSSDQHSLQTRMFLEGMYVGKGSRQDADLYTL